MAIPQASEFRQFKKKIGHNPNPLVQDLYFLLGKYHGPDQRESRRVKTLLLMWYWCKEYVGKQGGSFHDDVTRLLVQVEAELQQPWVHQALGDRYAGRRFGPGGLPKPVGPLPGHRMRGAQSLELLQPRPMQGMMADADTFYRPTGHRHVFNELIMMHMEKVLPLLGNDEDNKYMGLVQSMAAGQGGSQDTLLMLKLIREVRNANIEVNFKFLNKAGRREYEIYLNNGIFYSDANFNHRYTTQNIGHNTDMYAVDTFGNLYATTATRGAQGFNHSSFLAGKPVACAGELTISYGGLRYIDNRSGHYMPDGNNLANLLRFWRDIMHVSLAQCTVLDASKNNPANQKATWFLAAQNARGQGGGQGVLMGARRANPAQNNG